MVSSKNRINSKKSVSINKSTESSTSAEAPNSIKPDPITAELLESQPISTNNTTTNSNARTSTVENGIQAIIQERQLSEFRSIESATSVAERLRTAQFRTVDDLSGEIHTSNLRARQKDAQQKAVSLRADIQPNILNTFENQSYNLKFFMTSEAAKHQTIKNEQIIVIAETGSTGYNITDAEVHSRQAPGKKNKNTFADLISFTIIEPHGNKLFDQIRNGARALGIFNHLLCPYWFEVTFKGYTSANQESTEGGLPSGSIGSLSYLWRIVIKDIKVEINQGGTEYKITANPLPQEGFNDEARKLEAHESISANTLGEYFEKLTNTLNNSQNYSLAKLKDKNFRVRKYDFAFPKEYKKMNEWIIVENSENTTEVIKNFQPTIKHDKNQKQITFTKSTSLEIVIETLIGTTKIGQNLALYGTETGSPERAGQDIRKATNPAIVFTAEPVIDIIGYNPISNKYNILITYHIRPYRTWIPINSREEIVEYKQTKSEKRLQELVRIANVKKAYDYMFTGLNTEVLDYKIEFDNAWKIPLPLFRGNSRDAVATSGARAGTIWSDSQVKTGPNSIDPPDRANKTLKSLQVLRDEISQLQQQAKDANSDLGLESDVISLSIEGDQKKKEAKAAAVKKELLEQSNIALIRDGIDTTVFSARNNVTKLPSNVFGSATNDFQQGNLSGAINVVGANEARKQVDDIRASRQARGGSIFFVEDLSAASVAPPPISNDIQTHLYVPSSEPDPTNAQQLGNVGQTISKGRSFFSSIMNQTYGHMGEMIQIDLEIRGDPYWLGEPDALTRINGTFGDRTNPDLTKSDVYFLMTFDFPQTFDDGGPSINSDSAAGTGLVNIKRQKSGFNGIYLVSEVTNVFSNGKFTQKLSAKADPVTDEQDFIKLIVGSRN